MDITVVDSYAQSLEILSAPGQERAQLLRRMRAPMDGMYWFIPGGPDQVALHRGSFGFPLEGHDDQVRDGLETLREADAWQRVATGIRTAADALRAADPALRLPETLTVLLTIGDPTEHHFMTQLQGLSGVGGFPGYIELTVWPNETVLRRLEAAAAHEFHHNVRYGDGGVVWDPVAVSLGEQVVAEGLADVFAAELYGEDGHTHFAAGCRGDEAVIERVNSALDITGMHNFSPWVLGDATARRLGLEPVGVPTGAGYAAGVALVGDHLQRHGGTAAANVRTDWRTIARE